MAKTNGFNEFEQRVDQYDGKFFAWLEARDMYKVDYETYKDYLKAKAMERNPKLRLVDYLERTRGEGWFDKKVKQDEVEVKEWLQEIRSGKDAKKENLQSV